MIEKQQDKNSQKLKKISEIMKSEDISDYKVLAERIDISQGYLSEIINEKKPVPKTFSSKLEDSLGVNRKWFDSDEGEMYKTNQFNDEVGVFEKNTKSTTVNISFQIRNNNFNSLPKFMTEIEEIAEKYNIKIN